MKVLVTGAGGTIGRPLVAALRRGGHDTVAWDRARTRVDDPDAIAGFVRAVAPDLVFHLAIASRSTGLGDEGLVVNRQWPEHLARLAQQRRFRLVHTSTAMVFSNDAVGPFSTGSVPDATVGYGADKRDAERRVQAIDANTRIVRLGWQIGDAPGSNNMIDHFETQMREQGRVAASTRWYPACSLLPDTVQTLIALAEAPAGLYMVDANEGWTMFEIATVLNRRHGSRWRIEPTTDFVYDQRLLDPRVRIPSLRRHFPELPRPFPAP